MILLARFLQILLSVVSIKLSSHLLAPEQMGRLALVNSIVAFFAFMFINPIGMFMNRRMHSWWRDGQWLGYQRWYYLYVLCVAVLAGLTLVFGTPFYGGLRMSLGWMALLICGSILVNTSNQGFVSTLNLLGFAVPFGTLTILTPLLGLLLSWLLCMRMGSQTEYWVSGLLLGQGLVTIAAVLVVLRRWADRGGPTLANRVPTGAMLRNLFRYAWPISVAVILAWAQNQGYRLVLERQIGLKELGIFVAGYGIALGIMSAMESLLASLLQPRFYSRLNSPGELPAEAWNEYAAVALPILVLTGVTLAASATEAVHIFLSPAYWGTATVVCWAAAIELTRTAANTYSLCMHAMMKTRGLMIPSLVGAILSIGFLSVAAHFWGLDGVGPALALAGVVCLASWHNAAHRLAGISFPLRRVLLALAGGLLAFGIESAMHLLNLPLAPLLATLLAVAPVVVIYLLFARTLVRPALASTRLPAQQGASA